MGKAIERYLGQVEALVPLRLDSSEILMLVVPMNLSRLTGKMKA